MSQKGNLHSKNKWEELTCIVKLIENVFKERVCIRKIKVLESPILAF